MLVSCNVHSVQQFFKFVSTLSLFADSLAQEFVVVHLKEEKKLFPLQLGQEVRGFVTIKIIFRCWSYVTVLRSCHPSTGSTLSAALALCFSLCFSESLILLNAT